MCVPSEVNGTSMVPETMNWAPKEEFLESAPLLGLKSMPKERTRRADFLCYVCPNICCRSKRNVVVTVIISLITFVLGLLAIFNGVLFGIKIYVQKVADQSTVSVGAMVLSAPDNAVSKVNMSVELSMTAETFASAEFDYLSTELFRKGDTMPFGHLDTDASLYLVPYKENHYNVSGVLTILDMEKFSEFADSLYNAGAGLDGVEVTMAMSACVTVMGWLEYDGIKVKKDVMLNGLEQLDGPYTNSLDVFLNNDNPDDVWIHLETCFHNPSANTILNVGRITLDLSLDGTYLAEETSIDSVNMQHGTFCVAAQGPANTDAEAQKGIAEVFQNYINNKTLVIQTTPRVNKTVTSQPVFEPFLHEITSNVTSLPLGKNLVSYSLMKMVGPADAVSTLLKLLGCLGAFCPHGHQVTKLHGQMVVTNPFSVAMNLKMSFELFSNGMKIGVTEPTVPAVITLPANVVNAKIPVVIDLEIMKENGFEIIKVFSEILADHISVIDARGTLEWTVGTTIGGVSEYNQTFFGCDDRFEALCLAKL